jgi:hypothetical protein
MTCDLTDKTFTNEDAARAHFEKLRWPDGPVCPHCGVVDEATELKGKSTRPGLYKCRACQKPFTATMGTSAPKAPTPPSVELSGLYCIPRVIFQYFVHLVSALKLLESIDHLFIMYLLIGAPL